MSVYDAPSGTTVAYYLYHKTNESDYPDGVVLLDASSSPYVALGTDEPLKPCVHRGSPEYYGRTSKYVIRERDYASLVTDMYCFMLNECKEDDIARFAERMEALGLDVPTYEIEVDE